MEDRTELLAGRSIELVGSDPWLLSQLQRNVLVPLELQLMHEGDLTASNSFNSLGQPCARTCKSRLSMTRVDKHW